MSLENRRKSFELQKAREFKGGPPVDPALAAEFDKPKPKPVKKKGGK